MKKGSLKTIILWRVVGVIVVALLVASVFLVGGRVQDIRRDLLAVQLSLDRSLGESVYEAWLQDQLELHKQDITRIERVMPAKEEIGQVVGIIEEEANKRGITVRIPVIKEERVVDESGDEVERTSPVKTVRMQIQGQGEGPALIDFMHEIEHLPYLLGTVLFSFDADAERVTGSAMLVPGVGLPPGQEPEEIRTTSSLDMEIALTTWEED